MKSTNIVKNSCCLYMSLSVMSHWSPSIYMSVCLSVALHIQSLLIHTPINKFICNHIYVFTIARAYFYTHSFMYMFLTFSELSA